MSGMYVVEDVCVGEDHVRRLIFLSRPHLTQSEAILKTVIGKIKRQRKLLSCLSYHRIMVGSLGIYLSAPIKVLVVGLCGGSLPNYIHATFPLSNVHVVEIDPAIVRVAQHQFSFTPGARLTVSTNCGLAYIKDTAEKFNVIMLDVDIKDISSGMSCHPPSFLESQFLDTLSSLLVPGDMLVLNLVCRDSVLRASLM
jgi:spermidine synthase